MQVPVRDPSRRPPPEPTGTGIIRGRVVAADTGTPVRRATVALSMVQPPRPAGTATGPQAGGTAQTTNVTRVTTPSGQTVVFSGQGPAFRQKSATTDAQGAFEFKNLPP